MTGWKKQANEMLALAVDAQRRWDEHARALPDDERRKLFREFHEKREKAIADDRWYIPARPAYLHGLTCGARTRAGKPCRMTALGASGRCIWHGGASTGPRTTEGKAKALENLKLGRLKRGKSRD